MADTVRVVITATTTDAVGLTANDLAVTMRTAPRGGTVTITRDCVRWASADVVIHTTAHVIRSAWMANAGKGNAMVTTSVGRATTVTRGYAKRCVPLIAAARIRSAV